MLLVCQVLLAIFDKVTRRDELMHTHTHTNGFFAKRNESEYRDPQDSGLVGLKESTVSHLHSLRNVLRAKAEILTQGLARLPQALLKLLN